MKSVFFLNKPFPKRNNEIKKGTINENHEPVVSARQLHEALGIKTKYNDWLWFYRVAITQKKVTAQGNQSEFKK